MLALRPNDVAAEHWERVVAHLERLRPGSGPVEIEEVHQGNVNVVLKLKRGAGAEKLETYGARLRNRESFASFDRDVVKEPFVAELLASSQRLGGVQPGPDVREALIRMLRAGQGACAHPEVGDILLYDFTRTALPYPFTLFVWSDGECLWNQEATEAERGTMYEEAGRRAAVLHRVKFDAFYLDLRALCEGRGTDAAGRLRDPIAALLERAAPFVPESLRQDLRRFVHEHWHHATKDVTPCLVHNDLSGGNILVSEGRVVRLMDWDNWTVAPPETELVKMKYWTAPGGTGRLLRRDAHLFGEFLRGYRAESEGTRLSWSRLRLEEVRWLLLVTCVFGEREREQSVVGPPLNGQSVASLYPPSSHYVEHLSHLVTGERDSNADFREHFDER